MPTKPARKPKSTAPPRPVVSTPVTSAQHAPTSGPAKLQEKKCKQATETFGKPPKAKKSKFGWVSKKRTLKHAATSEAEDVPIMEPQVAAEDAELQKVLEESMKTAYVVAPRGPLPPVVIREPESGKYQPLPEVPGKGKAKVTEEQVAHDLLSLQKPKKKSPAEQYIFQRRISKPAGSSLHDDSPYAVLGQSDSEEESKKVMLGATEGGNDEDQVRPNPGAQAEGQTGTDAGLLMKARLDQTLMKCLKARLDQTLVTLEMSFGDLFFSDKPSEADNGKTTAETKVESMVSVTIQQDMSSIPPMTSPIIDLSSRPESPKVHEQFKATTTETTTTTTTLPPPPTQQQSNAEAMMIKRIDELEHIMANLIQVNKDMEERLDKHGARLYMLEQLDIPQQVSKAQFKALEKSMNRDHSEKLAQDLAEARKIKKKSRESPKTPPGSPPHHPLPPPAGSFGVSGAPGASGSSQAPPPPPPPPPSSTNQEGPSKGSAPPSSSQTAALAEYQAWTTTDIRLRPSAHIPEVNLRQGWWKPLEEERPATPEPAWSIPSFDAPIPPNNWASALASSYSPPLEDSLLAQTGPAFEIVKVFHPDVIHLQFQMEECHKLLTDNVDDPIIRLNVSKPLPLGGPPGQVSIQSDFFFNKDLEYLRYGSKGNRPALSISKINAAYYLDAVVPMVSLLLLLFRDEDRCNTDWEFFGDVIVRVVDWIAFWENKVFRWLRLKCIGNIVTNSRVTPSWREIVSLTVLVKLESYTWICNHVHAGLEQMVPDQFWIEEECKYDIAAMYGISHWWFQRQRFYIDRHTSEGDRGAVRTHMRILSVVRIEVFSLYGYDYMKKIVLRRAYLNEHVITEQDFNYLYPSDFEDLYLLNLQGHLNHLPPKDKKILSTAVNQWTRHLVIRQRVEDFQLGIESYQTQLSLTKPQWDATGFEYTHDYTVIDSPRAVMFQDKYGVQMMMCFNEIHKFSDGTLQQIDEALDYRVKEFRINRMNPCLNTRFWTRKDVDRCKAFMFTIQRRLRTRRIFRNLESFVGGRVRDGDYRLLKRTE
nr:hypothetical protein [Tanacetum cinerariifolium]